MSAARRWASSIGALLLLALAACGGGGAQSDAGPTDAPICELSAACDIIGPQCPASDDLCIDACSESFECCWCSDAGPEIIFIHCLPCDGDGGIADAGTADAG